MEGLAAKEVAIVGRTPVPPRNIRLVEPLFERSRLSEEFLAAAYEQVFPSVQEPVPSRRDPSSLKTKRLQETRRA